MALMAWRAALRKASPIDFCQITALAMFAPRAESNIRNERPRLLSKAWPTCRTSTKAATNSVFQALAMTRFRVRILLTVFKFTLKWLARVVAVLSIVDKLELS